MPDAGPFWDFSVAVYGRPGVAAACLSLQDRQGVDVNVLLFCLWCASRGLRVTALELRGALEQVGPWQRDVVAPLRSVRRSLKGAPQAGAEALRSRVAALELEAERLEQCLLESLAPAATPGGSAPADLATANVEAYAAVADLNWAARDAADLAALLEGAFPDRSPRPELAAGPI